MSKKGRAELNKSIKDLTKSIQSLEETLARTAAMLAAPPVEAPPVQVIPRNYYDIDLEKYKMYNKR